MADIKVLAQQCGGELVNGRPCEILRLITDSRKLFDSENSLFFALRGRSSNGSRYVAELYGRGVRAFVVDRSFDTAPFADAQFIVVPDTLAALQQIAAAHRRALTAGRVVAVTGSNGKTIVKEWLSQLMPQRLSTVRSPKSYNSQLGVPLSLWLLEPDTDLGIIEAGISQPGEMERLELMIAPDDVIVTNVGSAHIENFCTRAELLTEKLVLCRHARRVFFCSDHDDLRQAIESHLPGAELVSWGRRHATSVTVLDVDVRASLTEVTYQYKGERHAVEVPFTDAASVENAMQCVSYMLATGLAAPADLARSVPRLQTVGMRMEVIEGHNGCMLIDDAYNADITSLEIALDFLHRQGTRKGLSRTLILSDLLQTGLDEATLYSRVAKMLAEKHVTRLIGVGQSISRAMQPMSLPGARFFATTDELLEAMSVNDFRNEAVLLKGSRNFYFERIAEMLALKRNRTVLEINMNALASNIAAFRSHLKPETKLLAMVKAFSYGTGSYEIANLMQQQGVDYLGVAFADEGYDLRSAGIRLPIIVMNPEEHSFDMMLNFDLDPEIYNYQALEGYSRAASRLGVEKAGIHIKIDTGMYRSGFRPAEMHELAEHIRRCPNLCVKSVFSHLVGSDSPDFDDFTLEQIALFEDACATLKSELGYGFIRHILNSAGIERFVSHQCEMVRLGIGLYGMSCIDNARLKNVVTMKSYVSQIKTVPAHSTVGYSRRGVVDTDTTIAVVPVGYADGLDRRLSNRAGSLLVNGHRAPIIGNICMDICMIDISGIDVKIGDEVIIFGDANPVWEMAESVGTIPYEILTGISRRVKRIYYEED